MSNAVRDIREKTVNSVRTDYRQSHVLWWSYDEAAQESGLARGTILNYASRRHFDTRKRGPYRVDRVSFERFLNERKD